MLTSSNYTFSEFTSNNTHTFQVLLPNKSKHTFKAHINITGTLRELLSNNTTRFPRHQAILTFSESYEPITMHTFPEFTSNNADIFRELLANSTKHISRVYIKQY